MDSPLTKNDANGMGEDYILTYLTLHFEPMDLTNIYSELNDKVSNIQLNRRSKKYKERGAYLLGLGAIVSR